jgi:hypothetical protein
VISEGRRLQPPAAGTMEEANAERAVRVGFDLGLPRGKDGDGADLRMPCCVTRELFAGGLTAMFASFNAKSIQGKTRWL